MDIYVIVYIHDYDHAKENKDIHDMCFLHSNEASAIILMS